MANIALVDDDKNILASVSMLLEQEGYQIRSFTDPAAALTALTAQAPDLAILDIKMPGIDGLTAARQITADQLCAVVLLTAFSQRDLIEEARDAGALAYLVKPFQRSDLVPAIELAVGRFRELRALTEQTKSLEDQLETRKVVDKAKGVLMDTHGFTEADSFTFVQKTAMRDRTTMRAVAESILDGTLTPETP